jgi:oxidoreductase
VTTEKGKNKVKIEPGMKIRALVIGHTGATGKGLLDALIASPNCESIVAIGRRESIVHKGSTKLTQHILPNMLEIGSIDPEIAKGANMAFCCIGTTFNDVFKNSKAAEYQAVDFGIATGFAKFAKAAGVEFFSIITGDKSDSKSTHRMTRVKGETEDLVNSLGFSRVAILRPGLLNRGRGRRGWLEQIFTVGGIFGLPVSKVGQGMVWMGLKQTDSVAGYDTKEILKAAAGLEKLSKY